MLFRDVVANHQCDCELLLPSAGSRNRAPVAAKPAPLHAKSAQSNKCALPPSSKQFMDFLVLSHLRWDFVYQRPQHLLSRCARQHRVFFVEEPIATDGPMQMDISTPRPGVWVAVPRLPEGMPEQEAEAAQRRLLD